MTKINVKDLSVKISVIFLLLLCTFDMPYGFYQFVRIFCSISFLFLAYKSNLDTNNIEPVIFIFFTILFQPVLPISLTKEIWTLIDISIILILLIRLKFNVIKF
jgi:hypothetical protein